MFHPISKYIKRILIILLKILHLLHYLPEYLRAILRRVAILDQTYLYIEFELIPDDLIVKPIRKRGFCVDDLLDLLGQGFAFFVYGHAINRFILSMSILAWAMN